MALDRFHFESGCPLSERWLHRDYRILQLHGCSESYSVCHEGFLWRNGELRKQIPFHGDLLLLAEGPSLVARFYSGSLEWVRTYEELSEAGQEMIAIQTSMKIFFESPNAG